MEEHLQVRPHLIDGLLARHLEHTEQHGEHPRWHTRDIGHLLSYHLMGYHVALLLKVTLQCDALLGHSEQVDQRIDILYEDGRQVSHERVRQGVVRRM